MRDAGIAVSIFLDAESRQVRGREDGRRRRGRDQHRPLCGRGRRFGGSWVGADSESPRPHEPRADAGLEVLAGHGLNYVNVTADRRRSPKSSSSTSATASSPAPRSSGWRPPSATWSPCFADKMGGPTKTQGPRQDPLKKESLVMGVAGILLGLLAGWIIGSQQAVPARTEPPAAQAASAPPGQQQAPPALDEAAAAKLKSTADANPRDAAATRVQLGESLFRQRPVRRCGEWYTAALEIEPRNVDASTDLGIAYYYMNQPDRALATVRSVARGRSETFEDAAEHRHRARLGQTGSRRGGQGLAAVIDVAPGSEEAARAKQGLEGIRAAHPDAAQPAAPKPPGSSN